MAHTPINHPLRGFYRFLSALAGLYVLVFGVVAFTKTKGDPLFSQDHLAWALGLRSNLAFAILSIIAGAVILVAALLGRNIDHFVFLWGGGGFMIVGILMLALLESDSNFLGFSMSNCIVSFLIGAILVTAGLYTKTGTPDQAADEETFRHASVVRG
jgi:hypothetical protein